MSRIIFTIITVTIAISITAFMEGIEMFLLWPLGLPIGYVMCTMLNLGKPIKGSVFFGE